MKNIPKEHLCIACKERYIAVQKRSLCFRCYHRLRKKEGPLGHYIQRETHKFANERTVEKHRLSREMEFIKNFFSQMNKLYILN